MAGQQLSNRRQQLLGRERGLAGLTKLRGLGIAGTQVTDEGIARLAALKTLETLSLQGPIVLDGPPPPIMFTDKSLEVIGTLRDLRKLNVGVGSRFTGDGVRHLSGLTKLRSLTMGTVPFTDEAARMCEGMLDLEWLLFDEMRGTLSDEGLKILSKLHHLKSLRLRPTNDKVTDDGLRLLASMVGLEELGVGGPQFTDAGLAVLEYLPNLHTLWVSRSQITDKGMRVFKWLPRLRILRLEHTAISDAGTAHLEGLKHLTRLVLNDTKITDETLARVSRQPELLQVLSVKGTRVSDAAIDRLLEKLPNLQIER
ncbi:MAG: hypothetical protein HYX69_10070 [Planctomycetia bacterium]|nr:hypothetical protein [Planctomycetia bacterium]